MAMCKNARCNGLNAVGFNLLVSNHHARTGKLLLPQICFVPEY